MTRTPRDCNGKPIPRAVREDAVPEWVEEDTQPGVVPTDEELEAELAQHSGDPAFWRKR